MRWPAAVAVVLVLLAAVIEIIGIPRARECRLLSKLGIPSPGTSETILLSLPASAGSCDPMDLALALRGLSMLNPALILLPLETQPTPEQAGILASVKARLKESGIPLSEVAKDLESTPYRPVPLCRYSLPISLKASSPPPLLAGLSPADGAMRFSSDGTGRRGELPLLGGTRDGGIAGSVWWDGLMVTQPRGPIWLLSDHWLLLPDHNMLRLDGGGIAQRAGNPPKIVTLEDFLLWMEERERGTLSPRFDALWNRAVVILSTDGELPRAATLAALRESLCRGSLPVSVRILSAVLMSALVAWSFLTRGPARILIPAAVVAGGALVSFWLLLNGILPPLLPWTTAALLSLIALFVRGKAGRSALQT
jgi:hypothetical protein